MISFRPKVQFDKQAAVILIDKNQLDKKYEAILKHKSQTQSSAFYLFSFIRKDELFSDYPEAQLASQDISIGEVLKFSAFSESFSGASLLSIFTSLSPSR